MKRKALGRGLDSLIPVFEEPALQREGLKMIDVDLIKPGQHQPREEFGAEELQELSDSIKEHGIIQPVILRKDGEHYQLIAGERRWRAAQMAGLTKVPALVKDITGDRALEISLVENIQRKELNPIEESQAYQILMSSFGLSQEDIARRVGKKRSSITNYLRLLKLPIKVQELIRSGILSMGHAKAVASLEQEKDQLILAGRIAERALSVRQAESLAARMKIQKPKRSDTKIDPNLIAAEKELQRALGTKVRIIKGSRGGCIEIKFYSDEELDRLYRALMRENL